MVLERSEQFKLAYEIVNHIQKKDFYKMPDWVLCMTVANLVHEIDEEIESGGGFLCEYRSQLREMAVGGDLYAGGLSMILEGLWEGSDEDCTFENIDLKYQKVNEILHSD